MSRTVSSWKDWPKKDGYIRLGTEDLKAELDEPLSGKVCRVLVGGTEVASEPLRPD